MTQDSLWQTPNTDIQGHELPTPEQGLVEAQKAIVRVLRPKERAWQVGQRYDPHLPGWLVDVVRQGANGRWTRQRFMFDEAAKVLHYRGESALSDDEFRRLRREGTLLQTSA
jgi:hypothetical protein